MSRKPATASAFLTALNLDQEASEPEKVETVELVVEKPATASATAPRGRPRKLTSRADLKHIGGYLQDETVERFARLKIRTKLQNDELLTRAIDELWRIEGAKRQWER